MKVEPYSNFYWMSKYLDMGLSVRALYKIHLMADGEAKKLALTELLLENGIK